VGETSLTILIVKKMAYPQENLFRTDSELRAHGFVDQNSRSRRYNSNDYATGGSEWI
jgi:DNA-binding IclR family transcriptional regulator